MVTAYTLETLVRIGWRRDGSTFWTLEDARNAAKLLLKRKRARRVRILPVAVSLDAVDELPSQPSTAGTAS